MNEIFTRRSIRSFCDKSVEDEKIERILKAAMQAPSALNERPWEFIVIKEKRALQELSKATPYGAPLTTASVAILTLANLNYSKVPEAWLQDLGAATQNALLEAVSLELGAVWIGAAYDNAIVENVRKLYSLPSHIQPYSIITIGYPNEKQQNTFIDRYDSDRVHFEKY